MEEKRKKGVNKFIAFLLIAATVVSVVIFAASGNEADGNHTNQPDSSLGATNESQNNNTPPPQDSGNADEEPPENTAPKDEEPPVIPTFKHTLTGLDITEEEKTSNAFGTVIDPSSLSYGLSYADIAIEFPIEDGTTRMLFFSSSVDTIWKIGAIAPTRDYISSITAYWGGVLVANGCDDSVVYSVDEDISAVLDISKHADCYYVEDGRCIFTNENLINIAFNRTQLALDTHGYKSAPYIFSEGEENHGIGGANRITVPYSDTNITSLVYNETTKKYTYHKNGEEKVDMLTGQSVSFTNVFVLFANSTTYESSSSRETVFDTSSGGKGYYISSGRQVEFTWSAESGELVFRSLSGEVLEVNPGNSYITYYKASSTSSIMVQS